jgi:hypothetical protein
MALLSWLWPMPVGLLIGATVVAPIACDPGEPYGQMICAGEGGVVGLVLALVIRILQARRTAPGTSPTEALSP